MGVDRRPFGYFPGFGFIDVILPQMHCKMGCSILYISYESPKRSEASSRAESKENQIAVRLTDGEMQALKEISKKKKLPTSFRRSHNRVTETMNW